VAYLVFHSFQGKLQKK